MNKERKISNKSWNSLFTIFPGFEKDKITYKINTKQNTVI